jgi:hypothetical protein
MSEDALQKLIEDIQNALADGKVNVFEILRIIGDLIQVVNQFLRKNHS